MTSPSKRKGNRFELELVHSAIAAGIPAERAYASDGRALGQATEVDVMVCDVRIQAKRRNKIADYLQVPDGCDCVAFRQDRGPTLVLMDWDKFLTLIEAQELLNAVREGRAFKVVDDHAQTNIT